MGVNQRPWLVEKSALVRLGSAPDAAEWAERIERGLLRITTVTLLETGYSARSATDLAVLRALADRGYHRAPSIPDLLIAACAEQARLTVLHADKDFELIAEITGQPLHRLEV